jgi:hypothetical protein
MGHLSYWNQVLSMISSPLAPQDSSSLHWPCVWSFVCYIALSSMYIVCHFTPTFRSKNPPPSSPPTHYFLVQQSCCGSLRSTTPFSDLDRNSPTIHYGRIGTSSMPSAIHSFPWIMLEAGKTEILIHTQSPSLPK